MEDLLLALVVAFNALLARRHDLIEPDATLDAKRDQIMLELVNRVRALEMCESALEQAQPEVANTGSGAAPADPALSPGGSPAIDSASLTPEAAGTAPVQPQVQG